MVDHVLGGLQLAAQVPLGRVRQGDLAEVPHVDGRRAQDARAPLIRVLGVRHLHAEVLAAMFNKEVVFVERVGVEQRGDAFAGGHFAARMLLADGLVAAAIGGFGLATEEIKNLLR